VDSARCTLIVASASAAIVGFAVPSELISRLSSCLVGRLSSSTLGTPTIVE
jgi:hypothetical protein